MIFSSKAQVVTIVLGLDQFTEDNYQANHPTGRCPCTVEMEGLLDRTKPFYFYLSFSIKYLYKYFRTLLKQLLITILINLFYSY